MPLFVSQANDQLSRVKQHNLAAYAVVRVPLAEVAQFRKTLKRPDGTAFAASFLKPSDEQTIVGVGAVLRAIEDYHLDQVDFTNWGILAAPRYFGRLQAGDTIDKFFSGGVWKVSPLFVPHHSLHALSGTISQALTVHGPNFGVGGGRNAFREGLLSTFTMLEENSLPGLWSVLTMCDPEPQYTPDKQTNDDYPGAVAQVTCYAIALAFTRDPNTRANLQFTFRAAQGDFSQATAKNQFYELMRFLEQYDPGAVAQEKTVWSCPLPWGATLQIQKAA